MPTPFTLAAADGSQADLLADVIPTPEGGGMFGLKIGLSLGAVRAPGGSAAPVFLPPAVIPPAGTTLRLTFDRAVTGHAGVYYGLGTINGNYVSGEGTSTLVYEWSAYAGQVFPSVLHYGQPGDDPGDIVAVAGGLGLTPFEGGAIDNQSTAPPPAAPGVATATAAVNGFDIVIAWDQDIYFVGGSSHFHVTVEGAPATVFGASWTGPAEITLSISDQITEGAAVLLSVDATAVVGASSSTPNEAVTDFVVTVS